MVSFQLTRPKRGKERASWGVGGSETEAEAESQARLRSRSFKVAYCKRKRHRTALNTKNMLKANGLNRPTEEDEPRTS